MKGLVFVWFKDIEFYNFSNYTRNKYMICAMVYGKIIWRNKDSQYKDIIKKLDVY